MEALRADCDALCEEWDAWSVAKVDAALKQVTLRRSDDHPMTLTVSLKTGTYPSGVILLATTVGAAVKSYEGKKQRVSDALDDALVKWEGAEHDADDATLEQATIGVERTIHEDEVARRLQKVQDSVALLGPTSACYNDNVRKCFVVHVGIDLSHLGQFRCNALSLDRLLLLVVAVRVGYDYLHDGDVKVQSVFMCDKSEVHRPIPVSFDDRIGALRWYFTNRLDSALRSNVLLLQQQQQQAGKVISATASPAKMTMTTPGSSSGSDEASFLRDGCGDFFVGLHRYASWRLDVCTSRCLVCDAALSFAGMKPGICDKALCEHSVEQYGIGVNVCSEVERYPEVCELLIALSCASAATGDRRDTFTPMCPVDISTMTISGSSGGGGSTNSSGGSCGPGSPSGSSRLGPAHFYVGKYGDEKKKNFRLLFEVIQQIPSMTLLKAFAKGSNVTLRQRLSATNPLIYPTLQWILTSNRAHLEPIPPQSLIPGLGEHQFHLVSSHPDKEQRFRQRRLAAERFRGPGKGSFFAWHGSGCCNWHCILRLGLKNMSGTKLMSTGQVFGPGIYLAKLLSTSLAYMGAPEGGWKGAERLASPNGFTVISLCEVVADPVGTKKHNGDIVTVQEEDLVSTRFLFVFPGGFTGDGSLSAEALEIPVEALMMMNAE